MTTRLPRNDYACRLLGVTSAALLCLGVSTHHASAEDLTPARIKAATGAVDSAMIKANTATSQDWPTIGLDYAETRFSKLNQINSDNVKGLGLVWSYSLDSERGIEATPVVVDGIVYQSGPWSIVHAIDAQRQENLVVRSRRRPREGLQGPLRPRQSRRRRLQGKDVRRIL